MNKLQKRLLEKKSPTYNSYYNGKMSYRLHGKSWRKYVKDSFEDITDLQTSENIFKTVIDLYAENLVPSPEELRGFRDILVPLLSRGEALAILDTTGVLHFPEHYEMLSDGNYTIAAVFTTSLRDDKEYVTFVDSEGVSQLWSRDVGGKEYELQEEIVGNQLFRFALDDKGFGATLASLQDRINHSIIDQTVIAEMYARPFWYLLNTEIPMVNPYLSAQNQATPVMSEQKTGGSGRIFTTNSGGPFGQLKPPTIGDMIAYHDSIVDKVSQTTGIPQYYFKPGQGVPPTGVALKVMSKRFTNKIARMRDNITPELEKIAKTIGLAKDIHQNGEERYNLWGNPDDLLQDSLDNHGLALTQMGYPLQYVAEVVTPGVDINEYLGDEQSSVRYSDGYISAISGELTPRNSMGSE